MFDGNIILARIMVVNPQPFHLCEVRQTAYFTQRRMTPMNLGFVFLIEIGAVVHEDIRSPAEIGKAVQELLPIHKAQVLSYMKLLNAPIGLLINFHELKLTAGIVRLILPGANR